MSAAKLSTRMKKPRQSSNRKKSWRKHANVKDVENFLEEKRIGDVIERSITKKSDRQLFSVDRGHPKKPNKAKQSIDKKNKPLRCFQILEPQLYCEAASKPYFRKNTRSQASLDESRQKKVEINIRLKNYKKKRRAKVPAVTRDLWGTEPQEESFLDKELVDFYKDQIKQLPVKVPKLRFDKVSALPAVQIPDPGASYNPAFDDYAALVQKAYKVEAKKIQAAERVKETVIDKMSKVPPEEAEKMWLEDMSHGLFETGEKEEELTAEELNKPLSRNKPVKAENRRLRKRRKNELKEKIRQKKNKQRRLNMQRENKVYIIKHLEDEIAAEDNKHMKRQQTRLAILKDKEFKPRNLGGSKYEDPDIEVNLSHELTGSLCSIKAEGNVAVDRLKSLQRRNIIEPRIRQMIKRKYKPKVFVKKGFRDVDDEALILKK